MKTKEWEQEWSNQSSSSEADLTKSLPIQSGTFGTKLEESCCIGCKVILDLCDGWVCKCGTYWQGGSIVRDLNVCGFWSVGVESWGTNVPLIPREDCASFIGELRQTLKKPSWRLLANHTAYSWAVCLFLEGNLRWDMCLTQRWRGSWNDINHSFIQ